MEEVQLLGRATFGMPHMLHEDEPRRGQQAVHVVSDAQELRLMMQILRYLKDPKLWE